MKVVEGVKGREGGPRRRCVWPSISRFPEPHLGSQGGPSRPPAPPWIFVVAEQRRWSCGREGGAAGSDDLASTEITSLFVLEILVHTSCLQRVSTRPVCLSESLLLPPPFALPPLLLPDPRPPAPARRRTALRAAFRPQHPQNVPSRRLLVGAFVRELRRPPARRPSYLGTRRSAPRSRNILLENPPSSLTLSSSFSRHATRREVRDARPCA